MEVDIGDLSEAVTRAAAAERAKIDLAAKAAKRLLWLGSCVLAALFSILIGIAIGSWLAPWGQDRILHCPSAVSLQSATASKLPSREPGLGFAVM